MEFDESVLEQLRPFAGGALLREMIDLFITTVPPRMVAARAAIASGNAAAVREAMHSVKGSAGQMGAESLRAACERAEHAAARGEWGEVGELATMVAAAETELTKALAHFQRIRG